jgi:hypothetical protein
VKATAQRVFVAQPPGELVGENKQALISAELEI